MRARSSRRPSITSATRSIAAARSNAESAAHAGHARFAASIARRGVPARALRHACPRPRRSTGSSRRTPRRPRRRPSRRRSNMRTCSVMGSPPDETRGGPQGRPRGRLARSISASALRGETGVDPRLPDVAGSRRSTSVPLRSGRIPLLMSSAIGVLIVVRVVHRRQERERRGRLGLQVRVERLVQVVLRVRARVLRRRRSRPRPCTPA